MGGAVVKEKSWSHLGVGSVVASHWLACHCLSGVGVLCSPWLGYAPPGWAVLSLDGLYITWMGCAPSGRAVLPWTGCAPSERAMLPLDGLCSLWTGFSLPGWAVLSLVGLCSPWLGCALFGRAVLPLDRLCSPWTGCAPRAVLSGMEEPVPPPLASSTLGASLLSSTCLSVSCAFLAPRPPPTCGIRQPPGRPGVGSCARKRSAGGALGAMGRCQGPCVGWCRGPPCLSAAEPTGGDTAHRWTLLYSLRGGDDSPAPASSRGTLWTRIYSGPFLRETLLSAAPETCLSQTVTVCSSQVKSFCW